MEWIFFSLLCALLATQVIRIAMASKRRDMLVEIVEMMRYEGEGITGELKVIHKGLGKIDGRLTEPELRNTFKGRTWLVSQSYNRQAPPYRPRSGAA